MREKACPNIRISAVFQAYFGGLLFLHDCSIGCKILVEICQHVVLYADEGGGEGRAGGGLGIHARAVIHEIGVEAAGLLLLVGEVAGELVDHGAHHLEMSEFLHTDVGEEPRHAAVGHGETLA